MKYLKALRNYNDYIFKGIIYRQSPENYKEGSVINDFNKEYLIGQSLYYTGQLGLFMEVTKEEFDNQFNDNIIIEIY